jgi:TM2 domain-containing membrane protein YozV
MLCPDCGQTIPDNAAVCHHCGRPIQGEAPPLMPMGGGTYPAGVVTAFAGKKVVAGICGILLGAFGVHKFVLGLTTPGVIMLLITILTCGLGSIVTSIIGLIEGIMYLTKSDADFYQTYAVEKKGWF